jgi:HIV Tat-specific factor 1
LEQSESIDLALQILDGSDLRGHIVSVERARFELKGSYDPSKKRRKLTKQEKKKWREKQEKYVM